MNQAPLWTIKTIRIRHFEFRILSLSLKHLVAYKPHLIEELFNCGIRNAECGILK
jgi:hypothetical protein